MTKRLYQTVYKLKRLYGYKIYLYQQGNKSTDLQTGEIVWTGREVTEVKRAIVLPVKLVRDQEQSISMISFDKKFVMGGMFDRAERWVYIDPKDLPANYVIERDDWIVYRGRKYEIKEVMRNEFDLLWQIKMSELVGVTPEQIHDLTGYHILDFNQIADAVVEVP